MKKGIGEKGEHEGIMEVLQAGTKGE